MNFRQGTLLAGAISLFSAPTLAQSRQPDSVAYVLSAASRFEVKTGKAGLLGFAGHTHVVRAGGFTGGSSTTERASESRVEINVPANSLAVLETSDTAEVRKITQAMRTEVLHVDEYPVISFVSESVNPLERRIPRPGPAHARRSDARCEL